MKEFSFNRRLKDTTDSDNFLEIIKQYQEAGKKKKKITKKIREYIE